MRVDSGRSCHQGTSRADVSSTGPAACCGRQGPTKAQASLAGPLPQPNQSWLFGLRIVTGFHTSKLRIDMWSDDGHLLQELEREVEELRARVVGLGSKSGGGGATGSSGRSDGAAAIAAASRAANAAGAKAGAAAAEEVRAIRAEAQRLRAELRAAVELAEDVTKRAERAGV